MKVRIKLSILLTALSLATGCEALVGANCRAGLALVSGECRPPAVDLGSPDAGLSEPDPADASGQEGPSNAALADADDEGWPVGQEFADAGTARPEAGVGPVVRPRPDPRPGFVPDRPVAPCTDEADDCWAQCAWPTVACGSDCADLRTNDRHCGACGVDCGADLCVDGACTTPRVGHLVVIGFDFSAPEVNLESMFGNATQIPLESPLRIGIYEGTASSTVVARVWRVLADSADAVGRPWMGAGLDEWALPAELLNLHVLVLLPQAGQTASELRSRGQLLGPLFSSFMQRGGVVVALESAEAPASSHLLQGAGLAALGPRVALPERSVLLVTAPADSVSRDIPLRFQSEVALLGYPGASGVVSAGSTGVVLHLTYLPAL